LFLVLTLGVTIKKKKAFKGYNVSAVQLEGNLYGVVYYFHRVPTQIDADNISKPIWDALNEIAFQDDRNIVLRIAGVFNLNLEQIDVIDLSQMPDLVLDDFSEMINENGGKQRIIYVEIGKLNYNLFRFGYEISEV
ncbi:MAG: RusA family crossover junction endodeoxyribonuclease, partial [Candidatus Poribacteria bacterium]